MFEGVGFSVQAAHRYQSLYSKSVDLQKNANAVQVEPDMVSDGGGVLSASALVSSLASLQFGALEVPSPKQRLFGRVLSRPGKGVFKNMFPVSRPFFLLSYVPAWNSGST